MDYYKQYMYRMLGPPVCDLCGKNEAKWCTLYCSQCFAKIKGKKKKYKKSNPTSSKPLKCGGYGYEFIFDKMIQPQDLRSRHLAGTKTSKDRGDVRTHRKRQRRVNEFLIQEELAAMSQEDDSTEVFHAP